MQPEIGLCSVCVRQTWAELFRFALWKSRHGKGYFCIIGSGRFHGSHWVVMNSTFKTALHHKLFQPAFAAALTVLLGLALWALPSGERSENASYDSLFRFSTWPVTNRLVLVFMDDKSLKATGQSRTNSWDRAIHARFLNRLAEDGCPLVVMDVFFDSPGPSADATRALLESMQRLSNVVIMAEPTNIYHTNFTRLGGAQLLHSVQPLPPLEIFLDAVRRTNWGLGGVKVDADGTVRQHWKFPAPGIYESLAARPPGSLRAWPDDSPPERWIRYYAPGYAWTSLSYVDAETQPTNFFRDKIVFIGNQPTNTSPGEVDEFLTPFSYSTKGQTNAVAGVEILATEFLNIVNDEWLRRLPRWAEFSILFLTGVLLAATFRGRRVWLGFVLAAGAALAALVGGVCLSHFTNYWFPWLIIVGAQVPVAFVYALPWSRLRAGIRAATSIVRTRRSPQDGVIVLANDENLRLPDYELIHPPFGAGAYGKVWLARNAVNQWQAIKVVYRAKFGDDASPYEREFRGIQNYKSVSDQHPGLLRIDFVSRMKPEGYFYYAMELGDATERGWTENPAAYKPLDLAAVCATHDALVPVRECVRIASQLCEALSFLHGHGLTHRDIKPRNVIFVHGQPKLADVGLVADAHRPVQDVSWVGTPGYMPPEPEPPGTPQADIYGLGMLLYVICTGLKPADFPELSTTIVDHKRHPDFPAISPIIFCACQSNRGLRYQTAEEMRAALLEVEAKLSRTPTSG